MRRWPSRWIPIGNEFVDIAAAALEGALRTSRFVTRRERG
jgi:hypothetical protein